MSKESFDWKTALAKPGFHAAGVLLMKHSPGHEIWESSVSVGMKLIIKHSLIPEMKKKRKQSRRLQTGYWPVTVVQVQGYYVRLRYEGMDQDSHDIWLHIGIDSVYPVGGEGQSFRFIPPSSIKRNVADWRSLLTESLSGQRTLPLDFKIHIRRLVNSRKFKIGDELEVIDKDKISQLRIGRITKFIGHRIYFQYVDSPKEGFYCHEDSPLIHLMGWAACVGHKIKFPDNYDLPPLYKSGSNCNMQCKTTGSNASPKDKVEILGKIYEVGMKLEAVDPLCPSRICAATICKLLQYGNFMIKMDCYENRTETGQIKDDDWFSYSIDSPYIFQCGFSKQNGISMTPPLGYDSQFTWIDYFEKNPGIVAAPIPLKPTIDHGFQPGMKLEMADVMMPSNIYVGSIRQVFGRLLRINFDGWHNEYDQWVDAQCPDIYPIGWCSLVGQKLQPIPNDPLNKNSS